MIIELELVGLLALELWRERRTRRTPAPPPPALVVSLDPKALAQPFVDSLERLLVPEPAPEPITATRAAADTLTAASVEIVKRAGESWVHVGHRHATHPDLAEALRTPGLAVRHSDGRIEGGQ
jgi:hypothetical protein